jgi:AcrR family transcriptional regulator
MLSMSVMDRRQREKLALRQEILTAARQLFAKEGYESVSMRRIAEKIEYSPTTIYLYFRDKHELIHELCEESFALLTKKIEKAVAADGDAIERLQKGLRAYVDFGIQHPNHYRTTFMTPREEQDKDKSIEDSEGMRAFQILVTAVTECVRNGLFRETDVMAVSQSLWLVVHGITSLQITHRDCFPWVEKNRLIDLTIDTAVRGLMVDGDGLSSNAASSTKSRV